ncbi:MAG: hypothetical protein A2W23_03940 [Planctomycetes bacterium RBG_16_43_13]|nr:MAG: hypothetical protein A2W23_03940 [Planctomycetes bacterium RBG_16_43_13]
MRYRTFGRTGLKISEIGFGAWAIGGVTKGGKSYGSTDDKKSAEAIKKALDLGCNFFDTADIYGRGHSEELVGRALQGIRKDVVIASKVGFDFYNNTPAKPNFTPEYIKKAIEKSLQRLGTDYIDIYQIHNPPLEVINKREAIDALFELKKKGHIRFVGVSIIKPDEALASIELGVETIQLVYNILKQEHAKEVLPQARGRGVGIIAREPLERGILAGKYNANSKFPDTDIRSIYKPEEWTERVEKVERLRFLVKGDIKTMAQAALKFVLANDVVSTAIPGAKTPEQVADNIAASDAEYLSKQDMDKIFEIAGKK